MRAAGKVLGLAVLLCAMTAVGCQKRVELIFVNNTPNVLDVKVTTPGEGTENAGQVGGHGSQLPYTVRINVDDLPASCTAAVGLVSKTFTVNQDTKDKLWFYYTKKGLAGPVDKDTTFVDVQQTGEITVKKPPWARP